MLGLRRVRHESPEDDGAIHSARTAYHGPIHCAVGKPGHTSLFSPPFRSTLYLSADKCGDPCFQKCVHIFFNSCLPDPARRRIEVVLSVKTHSVLTSLSPPLFS